MGNKLNKKWALIKLNQPSPADYDAADGQKSLINLFTPLVTNQKPLLQKKPSEGILDDSVMFSQTATVFDVSLCEPWNDSLGSKGPANHFLGIIGSVRIQLGWPLAPSTTRAFVGWNRIHQWYRQLGVM